MNKLIQRGKIQQDKRVRKLLQSLPSQSYCAYQDFLKELRQGKPLAGERPVISLPRCFDYQLCTGELVIIQRKELRTIIGVTIQITIKDLISSSSHDAWRIIGLINSREDRPLQVDKAFINEVSVNVLDNAQRVIFVGQILGTIGTWVTVVLVSFTPLLNPMDTFSERKAHIIRMQQTKQSNSHTLESETGESMKRALTPPNTCE